MEILQRVTWKGHGSEVMSDLRYDTTDPLAVSIDFIADDGEGGFKPITWTFDRTLLIEGLSDNVGYGDVKFSRSGPRLVIDLSSNEGGVRLHAPIDRIVSFVEEILVAVPLGEEVIDLDAELHLILGD